MNRWHAKLRSWHDRLSARVGQGAVPDASRQTKCVSAATVATAATTAQPGLEQALIFLQQGNPDRAESICRALLQIQPDQAEALHLLGAVQAQRLNLAEALELIGRAIEIDPYNPNAFLDHGNLLKALQRNEDALASYDRALALNPGNAEALNNRGAVLGDLGRYEEALASYDDALVSRPDYADAFFNRGIVLACLNRKAEALASYDRAVVFNPQFVDAFNNRGVLLASMNRHDGALASFDRALVITPDSVGNLANRGGVFRALGLHQRAAQDFARVLELDPECEYAAGTKFDSDLNACDWRQYQATRERILDAVRSGKRASFPFSLLMTSDVGADQLQCTRTYVADKCPLVAKPLWTGERYQHQRIRIAYLSSDLRNHAVAYLMAELFESHDKSRFEVSAWSFGPAVEDEMRTRLRKSFEQFNDVGHLADSAVAAMLRAREIDIAVDLNGYTDGCRTAIFAHRAVPIQVNYLGYPGTIGADYMDYIIGDRVVIPAGHEAFYAEKVVRLPDSYQVNDSKRAISERTPSRAEVKLPESGFVFCCFNKNYKIVPEVFDIWMRLLKRIEGSVLWLSDDNAAACRNLRAEAESRGVRAERLVFAAHASLPDHLARHRLADLFLDTLPYNAHTTTSDALWAGLPVLTCLGNSFPGRVAASLLHAIGLPELITENLADYEALALKLATTPELLAEIRTRLARNRTTYPLFNIDRCRRHVESAYITMHECYQRGEPPQSFAVQPIS